MFHDFLSEQPEDRPENNGLSRVTWRWRATPFGCAIDAVGTNGEVLMSYLHPDATMDDGADFAGLWRRVEPALRAAIYGVIVIEILIAAMLAAFGL